MCETRKRGPSPLTARQAGYAVRAGVATHLPCHAPAMSGRGRD
jgi:hypothetical protein